LTIAAASSAAAAQASTGSAAGTVPQFTPCHCQCQCHRVCDRGDTAHMSPTRQSSLYTRWNMLTMLSSGCLVALLITALQSGTSTHVQL